MKQLLPFVLVLLLAAGASALEYRVTSHEINVDVEQDGSSVVNERYYLVFESKAEADEFARIKNNELQSDPGRWEKFDPELRMNFGSEPAVASLQVDFADEPTGELLYYVQFKYSFKQESKPFIESMQETGRKAQFTLNKLFVGSLVVGTDYVIPGGTTLKFILPPNSEPEGKILKESKATVISDFWTKRSTVILQGYFAVYEFDFGFSYLKEIAPRFSIAMLFKEFSENTTRETQLALAFVLFMILFALYAGRHKIEKRVTGFMIKHSDLSQEELEEE